MEADKVPSLGLVTNKRKSEIEDPIEHNTKKAREDKASLKKGLDAKKKKLPKKEPKGCNKGTTIKALARAHVGKTHDHIKALGTGSMGAESSMVTKN